MKGLQPCTGILIINGIKIDTISVCTCGLEQDFWNKISIGDTIFKEKGSIYISQIMKSDTIKYLFPCCDH